MPPENPLTVAEEQAYARVSWRLLPFLFLCYICAYLDRVNLGFAKLQMMSDLHLGDAAYAMGASLFFIGYFFFEVPSNLLMRRFGARMWIARIMVTWGIISAAMLFVKSVPVFYALRVLLGLAEAGFFPGIVYYLSTWYPARMRARKTAYFMAAIAVAGIVGNPLSGWIMDALSGAAGLKGWQWLFLLEGIPSILVGLMVLVYLDNSIEDARWLTDEQKALLRANIDREDGAKSHASVWDAFRSGHVWLLCLVYFTVTVGLYGVGFWLPTMTKALGLSEKSYLGTGLLSAIPYGAAIVAMFAIGIHSDRTGERRWHCAGAMLAASLGLVLCGLTGPGHPAVSIACLSVATAGIISAIPLFWTLPTGFLASAAAAAGIGLINSVGNLGGYVGPNIPVWVKGTSPNKALPLYVIAAALLLGGLLVAACGAKAHVRTARSD